MTVHEPARHNESRIGEGIERVCAALLRADQTDPSPEDILSFAARDPLLSLPHVYRLAARQKLVTGITIYFQVLAPDPSVWRFAGNQVPLARKRADLLFEGENGDLLLDEIKAGVVTGPRDPGLNQQIEDLLQAGRGIYGDRLQGVRAILLSAPFQSFLLTPTGERRQLLAAA